MPPAYWKYLQRAQPQDLSLWRSGFAFFTILLIWLTLTGVVVASIGVGGLSLMAFLLTIVAFIPLVWLMRRHVHRSSFAVLLGYNGFGWRDCAKGLMATLFVSGGLGLFSMIMVPDLYDRTSLEFGTWLVRILPILPVLFLQCLAEEVMFRGYMPAHLAPRLGVLRGFGLPLVLFSLLHYSPATGWMNIVVIALFSTGLTVLILRTGRLGAATGVHFGTNILSLLIVSVISFSPETALYTTTLSTPAEMSLLDKLSGLIWVVIETALILLTLVHPRSPLCLRQT